jgi:hypothetical protein
MDMSLSMLPFSYFHSKNKLDGGLPKKDLGPHFRVGIKTKKSWGQ